MCLSLLHTLSLYRLFPLLIHFPISACFATRIAAAVVIVASFLDSQFAFCSMQIAPTNIDKKKIHRRSHEQVSDIEYIIPRVSNTSLYNT